MIQQALSYRNQGISIIPLVYQTQFPAGKLLPQVPHPQKVGKTKGTWRPYRSTIATENEIRSWFGHGNMSLAVVPGFVSNGLFVIDFDYEANQSIVAWKAAIGEKVFQKLPIVRTTKGFHVYVRCSKLVNNEILAKNEKGEVLIEVKGAGSLCTAPPSERQKKGVQRVATYRWVQKNETEIPFVSDATYYILMGAAAQLNRFAIRPKKAPKLYIQPANLKVEGQIKNRIEQYAMGVLRNLARDLSMVSEGERNYQLNRAAFIGGRYTATGLCDKAVFIEQLREACLTNNLIPDDGEVSFESTVESGIFAGLRKPLEMEEVLARLK